MNQNGCLQDLHHQRAKPAQTKILQLHKELHKARRPQLLYLVHLIIFITSKNFQLDISKNRITSSFPAWFQKASRRNKSLLPPWKMLSLTHYWLKSKQGLLWTHLCFEGSLKFSSTPKCCLELNSLLLFHPS